MGACSSIQFVQDLFCTGWSSADWSPLCAEEFKLLPHLDVAVWN